MAYGRIGEALAKALAVLPVKAVDDLEGYLGAVRCVGVAEQEDVRGDDEVFLQRIAAPERDIVHRCHEPAQKVDSL